MLNTKNVLIICITGVLVFLLLCALMVVISRNGKEQSIARIHACAHAHNVSDCLRINR